MRIDIQTPVAFQELYRPHRWKVMWGGRGGAKSMAVGDALLAIATHKKTRVLCAREKQNSIKESVHSLLANEITRLGLPGWKVTERTISHANGSVFFFMGLWNNIDSIKSVFGVDICWVEEGNTVSDGSWSKLIPTIRKPGSEIWVTFNPELKTDAAYQRFVLNTPPDAWVQKVSWRDNPWFSDEMRMEMDYDYRVDEERARHIWEGELKTFADGAVYAKQLKKAREDGRICSIPIENVETHTFWDLGRNDSTAIWFMQEVGKELRFIDYYEASMVDLTHYAHVIKAKGYNYGTHYLPHDVVVEELSSSKGSRKEILDANGVRPITVVPRIASVNTGIEQTRQMFPRCWFDEKRCERGLDALANYQFVFNEASNAFGLTPLHNWASNGADAFRQCAQGYKPRKAIDYSQFKPNLRQFE